MTNSKTDNGKPFPILMTDEEAEHFIETADLSDYDFSTLKPVKFELRKKDARVNMRLPETLLKSVKAAASEENLPYQRFMRDLLEEGLKARARRRETGRQRAP